MRGIGDSAHHWLALLVGDSVPVRFYVGSSTLSPGGRRHRRSPDATVAQVVSRRVDMVASAREHLCSKEDEVWSKVDVLVCGSVQPGSVVVSSCVSARLLFV